MKEDLLEEKQRFVSGSTLVFGRVTSSIFQVSGAWILKHTPKSRLSL